MKGGRRTMDDAKAPRTGVEMTALGTARARAAEHERTDRLFSDPYAAAFTTAARSGTAQDTATARPPDFYSLHSDLHGDYFALRTRFFDDYLLDACAVCHQVVILAAGLDCRAYRLPWPAGVRVFELDLPHLLAFKTRVLAELGEDPGCERVVVPADLNTDWLAALHAHGLDDTRPTAWLAEGVFFYLTAEHVDRILNDITALSAPGSRLGVEQINRSALDLPAAQPLLDTLARAGAPWRSGINDPTAWLARHGWQARPSGPTRLAERYARPAPPFTTHLDENPVWLIGAERPAREP